MAGQGAGAGNRADLGGLGLWVLVEVLGLGVFGNLGHFGNL
jgi:hypothetical protein